MKIILKNFDSHYVENSQISTFKYSLVSKTKQGFIQEFEFAKCRDYLNDIISCKLYHNINNTGDLVKINKIYGFEFDESLLENHIDLNNLYLLTRFRQHEQANVDAVFIKIIRKLERYYSSENLTKVVARKNSTYYSYRVYKINPLWTKSPYMMSMFTFILRICGYNRKNNKKYSTLTSIFKAISSECSDLKVLNELLKIDLELFIKNIDYILGGCQITGVNDRYCYDYWDYDYEDCYGQDDLEHYHNKIGLKSLLEKIERFKNHDYIRTYEADGITIAIRYLQLKYINTIDYEQTNTKVFKYKGQTYKYIQLKDDGSTIEMVNE